MRTIDMLFRIDHETVSYEDPVMEKAYINGRALVFYGDVMNITDDMKTVRSQMPKPQRIVKILRDQ